MKEIGTTCNGNHVLELTDEEFKTFIRLKQAHATELELRSFTFSGVPLLDYLHTKTTEPYSFDFDRERMEKFTDQEIVNDVNFNLNYYFFECSHWQPEINSKIHEGVIFINIKDNELRFECDRSLPVTRIFSENNGILDIVKGVLVTRDEYMSRRERARINEGEQK